MRLFTGFAAAAISLFIFAASADAQNSPAAEPVFPNDGTIGLVPPPGMIAIPGVPGLQDRAARASVLLLEMPASAYDEITGEFSTKELESQGVTVEEKRPFELADGEPGLLLKGYQSVGANALKKWILIARGKDQTGMVTVQFPEDSSERYSDATVEAMLRSVVFRPVPSQEELLARLPFTLGDDLNGYRVVRVLGASAVLLARDDSQAAGQGKDDKADAAPKGPENESFFIVGVGAGDIRENERESLAKRAISSVPGVKELRVERGSALRVRGQPGYELIATGLSVADDKPLKIAQWLRFTRSGYLRMVGVAPADNFEADFTAMRGLRDGIEFR